jgi:hypothetical protein
MGNEAYQHGGFPDEAGNELLIRSQRPSRDDICV